MQLANSVLELCVVSSSLWQDTAMSETNETKMKNKFFRFIFSK